MVMRVGKHFWKVKGNIYGRFIVQRSVGLLKESWEVESQSEYEYRKYVAP